MKIIEPSVELWEQTKNNISHVAKCARVCYGKESGNDEVLYKNLEKNKHLSMFRHETYYSKVPILNNYSLLYSALSGYMYCPYIKYITYRDYCYIITNGNFVRDIEKNNPVLWDYIINYRISTEEAKQIKYIWNHFIRYTFCVITQISTSREFNRVSPNSISEQSTRYVYEDGTICRSHWLKDVNFDADSSGNIYSYGFLDEDFGHKVFTYIESCKDIFDNYKELIDNGLHRQDARGILPLDTATKCIYTYSIDEWRHILDLRYYGTTGEPHPNAKLIAGMIRDKLIEIGYDFR